MYSSVLIPISKDTNMNVIVDFINNFLNADGRITLLYIITSDKLPVSAVEWRQAMGVVSEAQVLSIERGLEINYLVKNARSIVQGILDEAAEKRYDLIFFASPTYGMRRDSIFGSKIDEVVRRAGVETAVFRYFEGKPVRYGRILVPTSGYRNALRAVEMAEALAAKGNGEITLMYVGPDKSDADRVLGPLLEGIKKKGLRAQKIFTGGAPADAILKEAGKGYDLMMIGATERPYYYQFLLGSTADRLVREAPCPVLMVKTHG